MITPRITGEKFSNFATRLGNIQGYHQRAIFGVTAIVTQPFIDYLNPDVDKDTRKYSVARTCAKIIIGTLVGIAVRYATAKFSKYLIDKNLIKIPDKLLKEGGDIKERFAGGIGTFLGVVVSLITNFAIDMPLTKGLVNFMAEKYNLKKNG